MGNCDLCNLDIEASARRVSAGEFKKAVKNGLRPRGLMAAMYSSPKADYISGWLMLVNQSSTDWALCHDCSVAFDQHQYSSATPRDSNRVNSKDKTVALLLAIFFGLWTWCYTYKKDARKFWLNLVFWVISLGFWGPIGWIWAIVDVSKRPPEFYTNYNQADPSTSCPYLDSGLCKVRVIVYGDTSYGPEKCTWVGRPHRDCHVWRLTPR